MQRTCGRKKLPTPLEELKAVGDEMGRLQLSQNFACPGEDWGACSGYSGEPLGCFSFVLFLVRRVAWSKLNFKKTPPATARTTHSKGPNGGE